MVVNEEAGAQEPRRAHAGDVRKHKAHRPDDVRRLRQQNFALGQRLAHQTEFELFKVAQAAVNQFRTCRRRAAREIVGLGQEHFQSAARRVGGDARAVDAAPDHQKVKDVIRHRALGPARSMRPAGQQHRRLARSGVILGLRLRENAGVRAAKARRDDADQHRKRGRRQYDRRRFEAPDVGDRRRMALKRCGEELLLFRRRGVVRCS